MSRDCCDGTRHWGRAGKWYYVAEKFKTGIAVDPSRAQQFTSGDMALLNAAPQEYAVHRKRRGDDIYASPDAQLCACGRWATTTQSRMMFNSAREADRIAQRLNAGGPVFRTRWLALGGALVVAATLVQAVASVVLAAHGAGG